MMMSEMVCVVSEDEQLQIKNLHRPTENSSDNSASAPAGHRADWPLSPR